MSDLIKRETLQKDILRYLACRLSKGFTHDELCGYNPSSFMAGHHKGVQDALDFIALQPTPYNVDKVVEQLEECKEIGFIRATPEHNVYLKAINKAIEIVRKGGAK